VSRRTKYTAEKKYEILMEYENGNISIQEIHTKYCVSVYAFYRWRYNYEKYGLTGLVESRTYRKYSKEFKEQAVQEYLSEKYTQGQIVRKYKLPDKSVLKNWINNYNSHKEVTAKPKGMRKSMTNGRATTCKERIKIVQYCIAHKNDFQKTAEAYEVSYQQVYQWVKKYELGGEVALTDRRGRKKDVKELTTEQKMQLEMKKLEMENDRLRAENAFLKKLEELERRRY
jgi:transposase